MEWGGKEGILNRLLEAKKMGRLWPREGKLSSLHFVPSAVLGAGTNTGVSLQNYGQLWGQES